MTKGGTQVSILTTEIDFLRGGHVILPRTSREAARWPFCRVNYMQGSLRITVLWVSDMGFAFNCKELVELQRP